MQIDLILISQKIFTEGGPLPQPGALLISGSRIVDIVSPDNYRQYCTAETRVVELGDRLILPGFHDFHTHTYAGALARHSVSLFHAGSEEEAARQTARFAAEHPADPWVLGLGWYHVFWENRRLPNRKSLDRLIPHRPVFLFNAEYHGAWVNTEALKRAGIDKNTPDPPFGRIDRDAEGEPTGFLYETALGLVAKLALDLDETKRCQQFRDLLTDTARFGITSLNDMMPLPGIELDDTATYRHFEENRQLKLKIYLESTLQQDLRRARELRAAFPNSPGSPNLIRFSGLKAFLDGVATTYTARLVEPYSDKPESRGVYLLPPETVREWVTAADREGFRVRLHACGDGGVRLGLDCYEATRRENGQRDSRHTIEHIETLHPADFPRFKALGVIASIQPEHLPMTETFAESPYLQRFAGSRESHLFPHGRFREAGVPLAYASDFPVVGMNPLDGIYRAVTRLHDDGKPRGGWNPKEKVTLDQALRHYTKGPAYGVFRETEAGALKAGMQADVTVLDRNPFTIKSWEELREIGVSMTIFDGEVIYEA